MRRDAARSSTEPFRGRDDLDRLRPLEPETDLAHVLETVRAVVAECEVPLIGFAGAPFTLASYLIEGGPSKTFARTKALMHEEPELWHQLADRLADIALASLTGPGRQPAPRRSSSSTAGPGSLSPDRLRGFRPARTRRKVLEGIADLGVPRIHFGVGTGELLGLMAEAGADVVGVDWRVTLRRRPVAASAPARPCRATWTRPSASRRSTSSLEETSQGPPRRRAASRDTSSISVTASCPRPTPACSLGRRDGARLAAGVPLGAGQARVTAAGHGSGVVVMAYGTPSSPRGGRGLLHRRPSRTAAEPRTAGGPRQTL